MNKLIRRHSNVYAVFKVYFNADMCDSTHVTFAPNDIWVGSDYWAYQGEIKLRRIDRALHVMRHYEHKQQTTKAVYRKARAIALACLLSGES